MAWYDLFKLWHYSMTADPYMRRERGNPPEGSGVTQPDAIPDIRADGSYWSGGKGIIKLRDSSDFIDLSSVTNRQSRYKEYERLRVVPEIETAITVFADESCVVGSTKIATPAYGYISIEQLVKLKKADDHFLVYCYDFSRSDYTLGWAFNPRLVKRAETIKVYLSDGSDFTCTPDHRVLLKNQEWIEAGKLNLGDDLMPFYRVHADQDRTKNKNNQFARIFTLKDGWKTERAFLDEWSSKKRQPDNERLYKIGRYIAAGLNTKQIAGLFDISWSSLKQFLRIRGFSYPEIQHLNRRHPDHKSVVHISSAGEQDVYDLSVIGHENFATDSTIFHNCQFGENGHVFEITVEDPNIKEELEFLFFNPGMLNMDRKMWNLARNLYLFGDHFFELIIDPEEPKAGILKVQNLPCDSVYRIETIKGKLLEFQQSKEGPDYQSLARVEVTEASPVELASATAIRFVPESIIHFRIGDDRRTFYPYGIALVEPARGPAQQLRLMEDSMLVYRLCITTYVKLRTSKSYKYVRDIKVGDEVYSYINGKSIKTKVINKWMTGIKDVYQVESKTAKITGTATHPVLINNKETGKIAYMPISEIEPEIHQFVHANRDEEIPKKINRFPDKLCGRISQEQKSKYKLSHDKKNRIIKVLSSIGMENNKTNVNKAFSFLTHKDNYKLGYDFANGLASEFELGSPTLLMEHEKEPERINLPEYVDEEFASLMGFLIGDGCINYDKGSAKLLFCAGEIPELNEKYANLFRKYFGRCSFRKEKRSKNEEVGEYVVNCYAACRIIEEMGLKGNCYTKRIPDWVFTERKEIRKAFIKGLADAEGTKREMRSKRVWRTLIGLSNKKLVEDIKEVWDSIGLHTGHVNKIKSGGRIITINGVQSTASDYWTIYISETPRPQFEDILSVKPKGKKKVYDIEVDNDSHNFIANGIVVHNSRAPERRVFYIDVGGMPPFKAESFMTRMQDMLRKRKTFSNRGDTNAAGNFEERWVATSQDEDLWIPMRPNSNTRVETLPGAQNLGEIDDALYFRNKLFIALNFPKQFMSQEDPSLTRVTPSSLDSKFARLVERLQLSISDGLMEIAVRHLQLRGYPAHLYDDLLIRLTAPSHYREQSENEIVEARFNRAMAVKGSQLMADLDVMTRILKIPLTEAKEIVSRAWIQKLQELKLQVMAQNPQLMGIAMPNTQGQEMGTQAGGPNPMLTGEEGQQPGGMPGQEQMPGQQMPGQEGQPPAPQGQEQQGQPPAPQGQQQAPPPQQPKGAEQTYGEPEEAQARPLEEPSEEDIKKYDMDIYDYSRDQDEEEIDVQELGEE